MSHKQLSLAIAHVFSSGSSLAHQLILQRAGLPSGSTFARHFAFPWYDGGQSEGQLTDHIVVAVTPDGVRVGVQFKLLSPHAKLSEVQAAKYAERAHSAKWLEDYNYDSPVFLAVGSVQTLNAHAKVLTQPWKTISVEELAEMAAVLAPFGGDDVP